MTPQEAIKSNQPQLWYALLEYSDRNRSILPKHLRCGVSMLTYSELLELKDLMWNDALKGC